MAQTTPAGCKCPDACVSDSLLTRILPVTFHFFAAIQWDDISNQIQVKIINLKTSISYRHNDLLKKKNEKCACLLYYKCNFSPRSNDFEEKRFFFKHVVIHSESLIQTTWMPTNFHK